MAKLILNAPKGARVAVSLTTPNNCTTDETNTEFTAKKDDDAFEFGGHAKASGSCFFEKSYMTFKILVVTPFRGSAVVQLGQATAFSLFQLVCDSTQNLQCRDLTDYGADPRRFEVRISR